MLSADNTLKCHLEVKNSLQEFFMFCTWRKKKKKASSPSLHGNHILYIQMTINNYGKYCKDALPQSCIGSDER